MTGLSLGFIGIIWILLLLCLCIAITKRMPRSWWPLAVWLGVYGMIFPLPLLDEIVGKYQFDQLCQDNANVVYVHPNAKGRRVYSAGVKDMLLPNNWVRIWMQEWRYIDASTGETIVRYNALHTNGGWIVRKFLQEGPLTFKGFCEPIKTPSGIEGFKALEIDYIEPPKQK